LFEKCQKAQAADFFPSFCVDFPCHTQSVAASNRLDWRKHLAPLGIPPIFKQGLEKRAAEPGRFRGLFF
jgi:hypothetical protein